MRGLGVETLGEIMGIGKLFTMFKEYLWIIIFIGAFGIQAGVYFLKPEGDLLLYTLSNSVLFLLFLPVPVQYLPFTNFTNFVTIISQFGIIGSVLLGVINIVRFVAALILYASLTLCVWGWYDRWK